MNLIAAGFLYSLTRAGHYFMNYTPDGTDDTSDSKVIRVFENFRKKITCSHTVQLLHNKARFQQLYFFLLIPHMGNMFLLLAIFPALNPIAAYLIGVIAYYHTMIYLYERLKNYHPHIASIIKPLDYINRRETFLVNSEYEDDFLFSEYICPVNLAPTTNPIFDLTAQGKVVYDRNYFIINYAPCCGFSPVTRELMISSVTDQEDNTVLRTVLEIRKEYFQRRQLDKGENINQESAKKWLKKVYGYLKDIKIRKIPVELRVLLNKNYKFGKLTAFLCPITNRRVSEIAVLNHHGMLRHSKYEKEALESWIKNKPNEAPPDWPSDLPLPLKSSYLVNDSLLSNEFVLEHLSLQADKIIQKWETQYPFLKEENV